MSGHPECLRVREFVVSFDYLLCVLLRRGEFEIRRRVGSRRRTLNANAPCIGTVVAKGCFDAYKQQQP